MGSIRSRLWQGERVWFIDYIAADGRRIRQTVGAGEQHRRLARQILVQREAEATLGHHHIPTSQTMRFGEFAKEWLRRKSARVKPKTLESYEDCLDHHLLPAFGEKHLGAITRPDIEEYLAARSQAGTRRGQKGKQVPLAARTINKTLTVLKMICKDAVEQRALTSNPSAGVKQVRDLSREDGDAMRILQPEEIDRLLQAADEEPYRTLYLLAVHTGLRRGELLGLHWGDTDLQARRLHVRRSLGRVRDGDRYVVREAPLKTRYSRRMIEDLSPAVIEALLVLPAGDDPRCDSLFRSRAGGPMDPDNLDRAFKRHLDLAGLPEMRFHDLRHTHASLLIAAGVHPKAIQARLGHASITTTLNTYGHLMPSAFEGVGTRLEALLNGKLKANTPGQNVTVEGVTAKPRV